MQYFKLFLRAATFVFLFPGCYPCGPINGRKACIDMFYFSIVDKASRLPLQFGSYELFRDLKDTANGGLWSAVYPGNGQPGAARLYANPSIPDDTVYLRLDRRDVDTLVFAVRYNETKCCSIYSEISAISYNGQISPKDGDTLLFQK